MVDELRAVVRHRRGLVADRKKAQQRLHDQFNSLCPGLSAPAGHGKALSDREAHARQAVLPCGVAFAGKPPSTVAGREVACQADQGDWRPIGPTAFHRHRTQMHGLSGWVGTWIVPPSAGRVAAVEDEISRSCSPAPTPRPDQRARGCGQSGRCVRPAQPADRPFPYAEHLTLRTRGRISRAWLRGTRA